MFWVLNRHELSWPPRQTFSCLEIIDSALFQSGDYEAALKAVCPRLHEGLMARRDFTYDSAGSAYTSGTTLSLALITPQRVFFAALGDSPIIVAQHPHQPQPQQPTEP